MRGNRRISPTGVRERRPATGAARARPAAWLPNGCALESRRGARRSQDAKKYPSLWTMPGSASVATKVQATRPPAQILNPHVEREGLRPIGMGLGGPDRRTVGTDEKARILRGAWMVPPPRLERGTPRSTIWCSNQLSYGGTRTWGRRLRGRLANPSLGPSSMPFRPLMRCAQARLDAAAASFLRRRRGCLGAWITTAVKVSGQSFNNRWGGKLFCSIKNCKSPSQERLCSPPT